MDDYGKEAICSSIHEIATAQEALFIFEVQQCASQ